jgi:hypothetical protein
MKSKTYQSLSFLKIFFIIVLLFSSYSMVYGQEEDAMEDAVVSISFSEEDDTKIIKAMATDQEGLPIEELDLYFYVQRTFSLLPIGDTFNTTNENGIVEVEFPHDLPGDEEGNVEIIVKIFESDLYNDLTLEVVKNWGIATPMTEAGEKRSLWAAAANAPITLVLLISGMILVIWYINCYIIYILYRISKIKPLINQV